MKIVSYGIIALTMLYASGLIALIHVLAGWSLLASVAVGIIPGILICYFAALVTFALVTRVLKTIHWLN
ncbi:hypothetical protein [Lacipirellula sp.]|uniref:hypothetical protein n=1 Tax=Lacipirellula sp. TaxID=2691419 RepID=UPI003D0B54B9